MAWGTELVSSAAQAADRLAAAWVSVQPGDYDPSSGRPEEWGKAAPAGLLIWLFMGAALFFLIKSMNRHIKRVPKSFDAAASDSPEATAAGESPDRAADGAPDVAAPDLTLSSAGSDPAADKPE
jgi:hypothetical protein